VKRFTFVVFLGALLFSFAPAAQAKGVKADAYFGYSRVGANMYAVNTPGMNGWQLAVDVRPIRLVGIEGDISHYSQNVQGFSQQVLLVMAGPRVTVGAKGFDVFVHSLWGVAHENAKLTSFPGVGYDALSYALGGGGDIPIAFGLKLRATADYLGNGRAQSSQYSRSHFSAGVGLAYYF
jgi:hypothetical protein